jgi:hypothetical protein
MSKSKWSVFITVGVSVESDTELTDDQIREKASQKLLTERTTSQVLNESEFEILTWDKDEIEQWDKETSNGETQA